MAVVVAQLAARSLTIPDDMGSNPVTGNFYWRIIYCKLFVEKMKINNKRPGIVLFDDVQSEISARVFN